MSYNSKYTGEEIENLLDKVANNEITSEDCIPLCRDFSDDFNNDFAR